MLGSRHTSLRDIIGLVCPLAPCTEYPLVIAVLYSYIAHFSRSLSFPASHHQIFVVAIHFIQWGHYTYVIETYHLGEKADRTAVNTRCSRIPNKIHGITRRLHDDRTGTIGCRLKTSHGSGDCHSSLHSVATCIKMTAKVATWRKWISVDDSQL